LSNGELYTILTNKDAHGGAGALVGMFEGTSASEIAKRLATIPEDVRFLVKEVTLDMSPAMESIVRTAFPNARIVTDRFHVQQLVSDAVQELRIAYRREAQKEENEAIKNTRKEGKRYTPPVYENGDTKKELLARSRYLLFKPKSAWSERQEIRAKILFREYPTLKRAYDFSMLFRACYEQNHTKKEARKALKTWYEKVTTSGIDEFLVPAETIRVHQDTILNYFIHRSTNAGAESFNAKLKNFRAVVRGIRDKKFFLFRISVLYG